MSRPAKRISDFDKNRFSELLKKAKGNHKQADFADSVPMSRTYISTFINGQSDRPLMPKMLKQIAVASEGRVTYEELLSASGYDPAQYTAQNDNLSHKCELQDQNIFDAVIMGNLGHAPFKWSSGHDNSDFDLCIYPVENTVRRWHFEYKAYKKNSLNSASCDPIRRTTYGIIAGAQGIEYDKVSIVTNSRILYNHFINHKPVNLNIFLSVVMINIDTVSIESEEILVKPDWVPDDCQVHFTK